MNGVQPRHLATPAELRDLLDAAEARVRITYETNTDPPQNRPLLAEALLRNIANARTAIHGVEMGMIEMVPPQVILDDHIRFEFDIIQSWNIHRLGFLVPLDLPSAEGGNDIYDHRNSFPLRRMAERAHFTVEPRRWLEVRSRNRRPAFEEGLIYERYLMGEDGAFTESEWRVIELHNLLGTVDGQQGATIVLEPHLNPEYEPAQLDAQPQVQNPGPAHVLQPVPQAAPQVNAPAPQPHAVQGQGARSRAGLSPVPRQRPQASGAPPAAVPQQRPNARFARPRVQQVPAPIRRSARHAAQAPSAPAGPVVNAAPARPVAPVVPALPSKGQPGEHVGLKNAPSENLPLPAGASMTLAEIMTFIPNNLRSVDMIDRVHVSTGKYQQKALANMASAHRQMQVSENMIWHAIKKEMHDEYPQQWSTARHQRPATPFPGGLSVTNMRTTEAVINDRLGNAGPRPPKPSQPNTPIPFARLAENVKHLPVGFDALDLTRCVEWVLRNPALGAQYMYPTDYATLLGIVGGRAVPAPAHEDAQAIVRWRTPAASARAAGRDAAWEQQCAQHRMQFWPGQQNAPAAAPVHAAQVPTVPAPIVQAPMVQAPAPVVAHLAPQPPQNPLGGRSRRARPVAPPAVQPQAVPPPPGPTAHATAPTLPAPTGSMQAPPGSTQGPSGHDSRKRSRRDTFHLDDLDDSDDDLDQNGNPQKRLRTQDAVRRSRQHQPRRQAQQQPRSRVDFVNFFAPSGADETEGNGENWLLNAPSPRPQHSVPAQPRPRPSAQMPAPAQPYYPSQQYGSNTDGYGGYQQPPQADEDSLPAVQEWLDESDALNNGMGGYQGYQVPAAGDGMGGYVGFQRPENQPGINGQPEHPGYAPARPYSPSQDVAAAQSAPGHGENAQPVEAFEAQEQPQEVPIDPALLAHPDPAPTSPRKRRRQRGDDNDSPGKRRRVDDPDYSPPDEETEQL